MSVQERDYNKEQRIWEQSTENNMIESKGNLADLNQIHNMLYKVWLNYPEWYQNVLTRETTNKSEEEILAK